MHRILTCHNELLQAGVTLVLDLTPCFAWFLLKKNGVVANMMSSGWLFRTGSSVSSNLPRFAALKFVAGINREETANGIPTGWYPMSISNALSILR